MREAPESADMYRTRIKYMIDDIEDAYFLWQIYSIIAVRLRKTSP